MAASNSLIRRNVDSPGSRQTTVGKRLLAWSVAGYSSSETAKTFRTPGGAFPAKAETYCVSAAVQPSTCNVSVETENVFRDGTETVLDGDKSSEGRELRLFDSVLGFVEQSTAFSFLRRDCDSPVSPLRVQRGAGMLLLSLLSIVAVSATLGHCLVSRAGSSQQPLCASSVSREERFAAAQETPLIPMQNRATRHVSPASREKSVPRNQRRMPPAFLGAVRISSHAFFDSTERKSSSAAAAASPADAVSRSVSPAAFTSARVGVSATAPSGHSTPVASPGNAVPVRTAAARATPESTSTAALPQMQSTSSSSTLTPEFDVVVVGLGVGGHAAALHAAALGLRTAVVTGGDPGGTCVNRGCVPSKALLAVAKKVKGLRNKKLLAQMGIHLQGSRVEVDPAEVAQHAKGVVEKVRGGLVRSLAGHGITSFDARGVLNGRADRVYLHPVSSSSSSSSSNALPEYITTRNVVLAPGSTPFVPGGVELDEQQHRVMTSDACVTLPWLPSSVCIVGAGYIGLEFMDVFSSLGSDVTLVDSGPRVLPGVDAEIAKAAERLLLQQFRERPVTLYRDTLASHVKTTRSSVSSLSPPPPPPLPSQQQQRRSPDGSCSQPSLVEVQLINAKTKEKTHTLYTDACLIATGRLPNTQSLGLESLGVTLKRGGFVPVDPCMRVTRYPADTATTGEQQKKNTEERDVIDGLYCIGDANGQMMLAHAASAQGIAAVETLAGRPRVVNVKHIPAACFTSPEIAFVGKSGGARPTTGGEDVQLTFRLNGSHFPSPEAIAAVKAPQLFLAEDTGQLYTCYCGDSSDAGDTEENALKDGEANGFEVGKSVSHFKANTKAIAEGEAEGLLKVLYRKDNDKILGCHMIGMHASDLIQECATAISNDLTVQQLAFTTHTHPTLSEVVDAAWKKAVGMNAH